MNDKEIIRKLKVALSFLFKNDSWLLVHDLSERSITHKLAEYLQKEFSEYNVDCEYNGNIEREDGKKKIDMLRKDLSDKKLLKQSEKSDLENELCERAVFPDIIIHCRGTNANNKCIIEVKKSTSKISTEYDLMKLQAYTTPYYGNDLKYQMGVFIKFSIEEVNYYIKYFKDGHEIDETLLC